MRISYDTATDALYIHLSEMPGADAEEIAPGVVVDFGEDGRLVGIEIDHASKLLDLTKLETESIPLPT
ncbi:MAG: DUF2283 domain-containing protein [Dehalococcoidia bacterium]|nr:DUF2283 domain-containing protein [Dehalococcoidia bacterium]